MAAKAVMSSIRFYVGNLIGVITRGFASLYKLFLMVGKEIIDYQHAEKLCSQLLGSIHGQLLPPVRDSVQKSSKWVA